MNTIFGRVLFISIFVKILNFFLNRKYIYTGTIIYFSHNTYTYIPKIPLLIIHGENIFSVTLTVNSYGTLQNSTNILYTECMMFDN